MLRGKQIEMGNLGRIGGRVNKSITNEWTNPYNKIMTKDIESDSDLV